MDEDILEKMKTTREIVSLGLRERDISQISLKQPLAKAIIYTDKKEMEKQLEEIIKEQLNVKELQFKNNDEGQMRVELDKKLTRELLAEGYARQMSRQIQAFRKELGLTQGDEIKTVIIADEEFKKILETQKKFLSSRTNSKEIKIVTTSEETFKNKIDFKIGDKRGTIVIIC